MLLPTKAIRSPFLNIGIVPTLAGLSREAAIDVAAENTIDAEIAITRVVINLRIIKE